MPDLTDDLFEPVAATSLTDDLFEPVAEPAKSLTDEMFEGVDLDQSLLDNPLVGPVSYVLSGEILRGPYRERMPPPKVGKTVEVVPHETPLYGERQEQPPEVSAARVRAVEENVRAAGSPSGPPEPQGWLGKIQGPVGSTLQFGANVLGGFTGLLGSKPASQFMATSALAREAGELAGALYARATMDEAQYRNVQQTFEEGRLSWPAHLARAKRRTKAAVRNLVMGLNPAVTAAVLAVPNQRGQAFWQAFKEYPVESLLVPYQLAHGALKVGGKPMETPITRIIEASPGRYEHVEATAPHFRQSAGKVLKPGTVLTPEQMAAFRQQSLAGYTRSDVVRSDLLTDSKGSAIRVYHGSGRPFTEFDDRHLGSGVGNVDSVLGFFFTDDPGVANQYTDYHLEGKHGIVKSGFLRIKRPFVVDGGGVFNLHDKLFDEFAVGGELDFVSVRRKLGDAGYDGIIARNVVDITDGHETLFVPFDAKRQFVPALRAEDAVTDGIVVQKFELKKVAKYNRAGRWVADRIPQSMWPLVLDMADPRRRLASVIDADLREKSSQTGFIADIRSELKEVVGPKQDKPLTDEITNAVIRAARDNSVALSEKEMLRLMEGRFSVYDPKTGGTKVLSIGEEGDAARLLGTATVTSIVPKGDAGEARNRLVGKFEAAGIPADEAMVMAGMLDRDAAEFVNAVGARHHMAGELLGQLDIASPAAANVKKPPTKTISTTPSGVFHIPTGYYLLAEAKWDAMLKGARGDPKVLADTVATFRQAAQKTLSHPDWIVYATTPRAALDPAGNLVARWVPAAEAQTKTRFFDTLKALKEQEQSAGVQSHYLPESQFGLLETTQFMRSFRANAKKFMWFDEIDPANAENRKAAELRLLAGLRSDWSFRVRASDDAPIAMRAYADLMNDPKSRLFRYRKVFTDMQGEIAFRNGVAPEIVADSFDRYISHSLRNEIGDAARFFDTMGLGKRFINRALDEKSPRFKRSRNERDFDAAFEEMADKGEMTAELAARNTAESLALLSTRMTYYSELYRALETMGMAAQKPPSGKGWIQVSLKEEAMPHKAASGDPYNFAFGELAGKWVDPSVARELKLTRSTFRRAGALLNNFKLVKTAYNPMGYQVRNHIGDTINVWARTGIAPWDERFRTHSRAANLALIQVHQGKATGLSGVGVTHPLPPPRIDPMLKRAIDAGVIDPGDPTQAIIGETSLDSASRRIADVMGDYLADKPVEDVAGEMSWLAVHLKLTKDLPAVVWKGSKRWTKDAWLAAVKDGAERWTELREKGAGPVKLVGGFTSKAFERYHDELSNTALTRVTKRQEDARRLTAFRIAIKELGYTDAEAARFARETLHDYSDRPEWLAKLQTGKATQFLVPPFFTYGYKQPLLAAKTVLHAPRYILYRGLLDAMNGYLEQSRAQGDEEYDKDYLAQLRFAAMSSYGANRFVVGSSKELATALQDVGAPPALVRSVAAADVTTTVPLRDMMNVATMLSDFEPGGEIDAQLSRALPAVKTVFVLGNKYGRDPVSGEMSMPSNPNDPNGMGRKLGFLAEMFLPFSNVARTGLEATKASLGVTTGEPFKRGKTGGVVTPFESLRPLMAATPFSDIDRMNMQVRIVAKFNALKRSEAFAAAKERSQIDIYEKEEAPLRSLAELNLAFASARLSLQMAEAIGGPSALPRDAYQRLETEWKHRREAYDAGRPPSFKNLVPKDLRLVVHRLYLAMNAARNDFEAVQSEQ